jgi:peptidoglycan/LPS O-acetylase OafA/YrhL
LFAERGHAVAALLGAAVVLLGAAALLWQVLPGVQSIVLEAEFEHPGQVSVYYSHAARAGFSDKRRAAPVAFPSGRSTVTVRLGERYPNRLRIDFGRSPGAVRLHRLTLNSRFAPPLVLTAAEVARHFLPGNPATRMQLHGDGLALSASDAPPSIHTADRPLGRRSGLAMALALLAAGAAYLLLARRDLAACRAIADLDAGGGGGDASHIGALDGLRGVGALMVIADHTWGRFTGTGTGGVWLFFALSGFLLARPLILSPREVTAPRYWFAYGQRRLARILPMYYGYVLVVYALSKRFDLALLHAVFLQADGHLWAIPQELLFYLLLPPVMLLIHCLPARRPGWALLLLIGLIVLCNRWLDHTVIGLLGQNHTRLRPYAGVFLAGVFFCFLYYRWYAAGDRAWSREPLTRRLFSGLGGALLLLFCFGSSGRLWGSPLIFSQEYFGTFGWLAGALVFCILAAQGGALQRALSWKPLRALGIVGLSLYLLHPLVANMLTEAAATYAGVALQGGMRFAATLPATYLLACWTYGAIERPMVARARRRAPGSAAHGASAPDPLSLPV